MEPDKLVRNEQEISIGITLRHITSYMFTEYTRTIKELSTQVSPENKRLVLLTLVKEYYECVKKLLKFVKNCKKYKKFLRIDRLTAMMLIYKDNIKLAIDDLFFVHEMCKFYRTPSFNLDQSIQTINHIAHDQLKKDIGNALVSQQNFNYEKKEKQFEFIQKYLYNENLSNELNYQKMISQCESVLDIPLQLIPIQNPTDSQYVAFKENLFWFSFGKLVLFKMMPTIYRIDDTSGLEMSLLTYYCKEINFSKTNMPFSMEIIEKMKKKYQNRVNTLLYNEIKQNCTESIRDNNTLDLQLDKVQTLLQRFIIESINPDLFQFLKTKTASYISKYQLPLVFKDTNKEEILIEYHCEHMNLIFSLKLIARLNIGKIKLKTTKYIIDPTLFIIGDDNEEIYPLSQFPYQTVLSDCISSFELITINILNQKLNQIISTFIPFNFIINGNRKIDLLLSGSYLIFSIVINVKGHISFIDYEFNFNEIKIQDIKELIIGYIKTNNFDSAKFNEIVFEGFVTNYFNFSKIKLRYESRMTILNEIAYHFIIPKYYENDINIELEVTTQYADKNFIVKGTKLKYYNKGNGNELMSLNFRPWLKLQTTKFNFSLKSFDTLLKLITEAFEKYDEFFKNTRELLQFNQMKIDKSFVFLNRDDSIVTVIEKENLPYFFGTMNSEPELYKIFSNLINSIEVLNVNVVYKFILNQNYICDYLKFKLQSYSLMDNDCIISFSIKDYSLTFYYLSKLKHLEVNPTKKVFTILIPNFIRFFIKLRTFVNIAGNQPYFENELNYVLSPLFLQFKINNYIKEKTIAIQFQTDTKLPNLWKVMIIPNDIYLSEFYVDYLNIFNDELNLIQNLKQYFVIDQIYQLLISKFLSHITPFRKTTLTNQSYQKGIFVLIKDFNIFEIFSLDKFSILIEVKRYDYIEVYSNFSNNPSESMNLLDLIVQFFRNRTYSNGKLILHCNSYNEVSSDISNLINIIERF